jgi:ferredoxin
MPRPGRAEEFRDHPMIVRILRNECCGHGECVAIAPDVFALDSKNKAVVIDAEAASSEVLVEAAEACPCAAIVVEDDEGNAIFP